jgi:hypothetical protein
MTSLPFRSHLHYAGYMEMQQTDFHYASHALQREAKKDKTENVSARFSALALRCRMHARPGWRQVVVACGSGLAPG